MYGLEASNLTPSIRERNKLMLNNTLMSDISFIVKDSETGKNVSIPAHKYVLSIGSRVFHAMFYGELSEKNDFVELVDGDSDSLLELFRFLYCDETNLTPGCVLRVMYLAEKYMIAGLVNECAEFLKNDLDTESVFDILNQREDFGETEHLQKRCWSIIDLQTKQCLASKGFLATSQPILQDLLKRDTLDISELDLFRAILLWAEAKCKGLSLEPNAKNIRLILGDALSLIRISAIRETDFLAHVLPTGILDSSILELTRGMKTPGLLLVKAKQFSSPQSNTAQLYPQPRERIKPLRCRRLFVEETPRLFAPFERTNSVNFITDQPICISGVRIILSGNKLIEEYSVITKLLDAERRCLSCVQGCYAVEYGGTEGLPGFDIYFTDPILIKGDVRHFITIFSPAELDLPQRIGKKDEVTCAGVTFRFPDSTHRQFSELIFYPLAPLW